MSESYCEVNFGEACDDADPVEFCESRLVKARKPHTCSECGGQIQPGETYKVFAYKFEGEFGSDKMCDPCRESAGEFEYHIVGGSLWLMFEEEWDNGANLQGCLNRLETARAKDHMRQQWAKWQAKKHERQLKMRALRKSPDAVDPHGGSEGKPSTRV